MSDHQTWEQIEQVLRVAGITREQYFGLPDHGKKAVMMLWKQVEALRAANEQQSIALAFARGEGGVAWPGRYYITDVMRKGELPLERGQVINFLCEGGGHLKVAPLWEGNEVVSIQVRAAAGRRLVITPQDINDIVVSVKDERK